MAKRQRRRLTAAEAREQILHAAERRLIAGGPDAVRVQAVARDLGITDAAVHYHFGSRIGLLDALLRWAGRRLKRDVAAAVAEWDAEDFDIERLTAILTETYVERGYARLALWLVLGGWRSTGSGMLKDLGETLHDARVRRTRGSARRPPVQEDTRFALALLQIVACADPLLGNEMRRSVGLRGDPKTAEQFREWVAALVAQHLTGDPE